MDETFCLNYRDTGYFSNLICDYLDQASSLKKFYNRFPTLDNFKEQVQEREDFSIETRKVLVRALRKQYQNLKVPEQVHSNLELLSYSRTFTITTGHQLNIFSGPLYFIYKIVSTINLCKKLKETYPAYNFVPVYWMATEDHDFEEINHINLFGGKLRWERPDGGPVGRFKTEGIHEVIDELKSHLGPGTYAERFTSLLEDCYLRRESLAGATRCLVNHLFGDEGLVIVDGDDAELKKLMIPYYKKELKQSLGFRQIEPLTAELEEKYFKQVHAREINLFYLKDALRERIVKKDGKWAVLNTQISFDEEELLQELEKNPERFSPNVALRPLYQEVLLPNLAYIGGGGELAYWLQLKDMFEAYHVPFPMLVLRNSALWVNKKQQRKLADLDISYPSLFQALHELQKQVVSESAPVDTELSPFEKELQQMFDELEEVAQLTDKSMLGAVNAQRQKQLNGLEKLKKKLIKAEKRKHSEKMERIGRIWYELFPGGSLQERHDNLAVYYAEYGPEWIEKIKAKLNPLDFKFCLVME